MCMICTRFAKLESVIAVDTHTILRAAVGPEARLLNSATWQPGDWKRKSRLRRPEAAETSRSTWGDGPRGQHSLPMCRK